MCVTFAEKNSKTERLVSCRKENELNVQNFSKSIRKELFVGIIPSAFSPGFFFQVTEAVG